MKYVDEDGNPISGFFDVNVEMRKNKGQRVCMNPECKDNETITKYRCVDKRPIIRLGKKCWNCNKDEFLKEHKP